MMSMQEAIHAALAVLLVLISTATATASMAQQCTSYLTLDQLLVEDRDPKLKFAPIAESCIAGTVLEGLRKGNEQSRKNGLSCAPEDHIHICSSALKEALLKDVVLNRYKSHSQIMYGTEEKAYDIALFVASRTEKNPTAPIPFKLKGALGSATITHGDLLLANYVKALAANDITMANKPLPAQTGQCFAHTSTVAAPVCAEAGRILAGRALKGLETTSKEIEK